MKARLTLLAVLFLGWAAPARAHRLDEYLQATTIAVERDRLVLQLRLTPGVAVAAQVLAGLDANADGTISEAEQRAYAERVHHDLLLAIDGNPVQLRLVSAAFPGAREMMEGSGDILLTFEADLPAGGAATRRLAFENHHQSATAVYLVNCLRPRDPGIHVDAQDRSYDQARYQLDFTLADAPAPPPAASAPADASHRAPPTDAPVFQTFFWHGVHHILTGYDHLLFVTALTLTVTTLWDLVKVVSTFTLAHSLTLTLTTLDLVHLPERVVEPLIAASIVWVALGNLLWPEHSRGRGRLAVAFGFGLFHGLGFAGGLLEVMHGLPRGEVLWAIGGFSAGVEAGNQMVLLPWFGLLKTVGQRPRGASSGEARPARVLRRVGSAVVSAAGVYYLGLALAGKG